MIPGLINFDLRLKIFIGKGDNLMKRTSLIVFAVLTLALLVYASRSSPKSNNEMPKTQPPTTSLTNKTLATQDKTRIVPPKDKVAELDRINLYFQREVISKVRNCWKDVKSVGNIEIKFTYKKAGDRWTWDSLGLSRSTLAPGRDAVALKCMKDAARATSFAVEAGDLRAGSVASTRFDLYWSWPGTLPTNATEFRSMRMANNGEGGCDGHGTPAKCFPDCWDPGNPKAPMKCTNEKVCIGVGSCAINSDGTCSTTECTTGGFFGGSGGVIIY